MSQYVILSGKDERPEYRTEMLPVYRWSPSSSSIEIIFPKSGLGGISNRDVRRTAPVDF